MIREGARSVGLQNGVRWNPICTSSVLAPHFPRDGLPCRAACYRIQCLAALSLRCLLSGGLDMPKDLRTFLDELVTWAPDQLKIVDAEVDPVFEVAAIVDKMQYDPKF